MANFSDYDAHDHREWNKIKHEVQDPKWINYNLSKPKTKKTSGTTQINLGKHEKHDWQPLKGPFGPHEGKIVCKTCGGKWVAWLPKGTF